MCVFSDSLINKEPSFNVPEALCKSPKMWGDTLQQERRNDFNQNRSVVSLCELCNKFCQTGGNNLSPSEKQKDLIIQQPPRVSVKARADFMELYIIHI